jgi:hypothetical protein
MGEKRVFTVFASQMLENQTGELVMIAAAANG